MHYANGDYFEGAWKLDRIQDDSVGTMHWHDGRVYVGRWRDQKEHGTRGTCTFANGDVFTGEYERGQRGEGAAAVAALLSAVFTQI
jgi:hypothetical protein